MRMNFHRKLPIPQDVKKEYPLTERMAAVKAARDAQIRSVFDDSSDKFILVIGPCSADHSEPVLEYISRLRKIEEQVKAIGCYNLTLNVWSCNPSAMKFYEAQGLVPQKVAMELVL